MTLFCHLITSWSLFYFVPRNLTAKLALLICASSHGDLLIWHLLHLENYNLSYNTMSLIHIALVS